MRTDRDLTIILLDGLGQNIFEELLKTKRLPNIQALINHGAYIPNAVTSFPSMTGYCFYSFLTGKASPSSGIGGLRWFRREKPAAFRNYIGTGNVLLNEDIPEDYPLLFERFQQPSSSVNTYLNRGVQFSHKLGWALTTAKYIGFAWYLRALCALRGIFGSWLCRPTYQEFEELAFQTAIDDLRDIHPRVQWITAASIDSYAHVFGSSDLPSFHQVIQSVDDQIGRYVRYLKDHHMWDNRILAIVADHGISHVHFPIRIDELLEGISPEFSVATETLKLDPLFLTDYASKYRNHNVIAAVNGNNLVHLYFRHPDMPDDQADNWATPLDPLLLTRYPVVDIDGQKPTDVIDALAQVPAVDQIFYKLKHHVFVVAGKNKASVHCLNCDDLPPNAQRNQRVYEYTVHGPEDPLLIFAPGKRSVAYSRRQWIHQTLSSSYPFAPPRIFEMFESKGMGDLVITAKPGFDFGKDAEIYINSNQGGHGTLYREQMMVSYVLVGAGIKSNSTVSTALPEDIGATLIRLLSKLDDTSFAHLESIHHDGIILNELLSL